MVQDAIKYSRHGGTITINVDQDEDQSSTDNMSVYNIHVLDQGMGISQNLQKQLFEPKEASKDATNGIQDSNGLGLSICKKIAMSLGGDLTLNTKSIGCHFILQVKVKQGAQEDPVIKQSVKNSSTSLESIENQIKNVIESSEDNVSMLSSNLSEV